MMNSYEVYSFTDQPATCPKCGSRTEITLYLIDTPEQTQYHNCLSLNCSFEFIMEKDNEE